MENAWWHASDGSWHRPLVTDLQPLHGGTDRLGHVPLWLELHGRKVRVARIVNHFNVFDATRSANGMWAGAWICELADGTLYAAIHNLIRSSEWTGGPVSNVPDLGVEPYDPVNPPW